MSLEKHERLGSSRLVCFVSTESKRRQCPATRTQVSVAANRARSCTKRTDGDFCILLLFPLYSSNYQSSLPAAVRGYKPFQAFPVFMGVCLPLLFLVRLCWYRLWNLIFLTFICPCIANIFAEYNQQDATFHNLFISVRRSACFRWVFRPSS